MNTVKAFGVVVVAAAMTAAGLAATPGCAAKRKSRESQSIERTYAKASFINDTAAPVRLSIVVGERSENPPGMGTTYSAEPQVIGPGGTYLALIQERKPYGVGFLFPDNMDLVVRFKVESAGATWEPSQFAWYEVVGPMPEVIRLFPNQAGAPGVRLSTGRVELVPQDWWPKD